MKKLPLSRLDALFAALALRGTLYLPLRRGDQAEFGPYVPGCDSALEVLNTATSPKGLFFPQSEELVRFRTEGKTIEIIDPRTQPEPFTLFGVRGCDAAALAVLDRVFLAEPVDSYYAARREQGVIVTRACFLPEESCFCGSFGIDPLAPGGDVTTWEANGCLYWEAITDKGVALTETVDPLLEPADAAELTAALEQAAEIHRRLPLAGLSTAGFDGDATARLFDSPLWEELSSACLGCGSCTFVCPTCQCYDIRDFDTGHGIRRQRCWDSCMYSDFTRMAHGNPRTSQKERFRQRFMHKLVYFPANNDGLYSCVGCGRCVSKCPSHLNIVKVIRSMGVKDDE